MIFLVAGLAYGDEGKGATVDFLARARSTSLVVRYNGGAQAGHNVVVQQTPKQKSKHHCFAQIGSHTLAHPGARTYLSRFMLVNPMAMVTEAMSLRALPQSVLENVTVEDRAVILTPYHRAISRLQEWSRGEHRYGSCGMGIGVARRLQLEAPSLILYAGDIRDVNLCRQKLRNIREILAASVKELSAGCADSEEVQREKAIFEDQGLISRLTLEYSIWLKMVEIVSFSHLAGLLARHKEVIFEGAQGFLLDERHGTRPHNSWTDTTFGNAYELLHESGYTDAITRIGCLRSYYTRHGAGPFPTEDPSLQLPELHNTDQTFQGCFRRGHFDVQAAQEAAKTLQVDILALSHLDCLNTNPPIYLQLPELQGRISISDPEKFIEEVENRLEKPVWIEGHGPTAQNRRFRNVAKGPTKEWIPDSRYWLSRRPQGASSQQQPFY